MPLRRTRPLASGKGCRYGAVVPWVRKKLHGARVLAACDPTGELLVEPDQRVGVLYKKGGKVYRAAARNLLPDEELAILSDAEAQPAGPAPTSAAEATPSLFGAGAGAGAAGGPGPRAASSAAPAPGVPPRPQHPATTVPAVPHVDTSIHVYTDGACTGNPGPMGIGVVILDPSAPILVEGGATEPQRRELSEYLGVGTNNIAELTAIQRGLLGLPRSREIVIYSDSAYAIGLLSQNWKAKANQELVAELRRLVREFSHVRFVKVAGHAGVPENERCDELARLAIVNRGGPERLPPTVRR